MEATVRGLATQYATCLEVVRVNMNGTQPLRDQLQPLGTPEFFLLDPAGQIHSRWFGVTEKEEFVEVLEGVC